MVKSRRDGNGEEKFFAAVTRSCRTAVEISEKAVREEIAQGRDNKECCCV